MPELGAFPSLQKKNIIYKHHIFVYAEHCKCLDYFFALSHFCFYDVGCSNLFH